MWNPVPLGLLLALVCAAVVAQAQQPAGTAPTTGEQAAAAEKPEVPGAAAVAGDARLALSDLAELREDLEEGPRIETVRGALPELERWLRAETRAARSELKGPVALSHLDDMLARWRSEQRDLEVWDDLVTARAVEIGERLDRVGEIQADWRRRLQSGKDDGAPAVVRTRIEEVLSAAQLASQSLQSSQARLLELQDRVEGARERVARLTEQILAAQEQSRSAMLEATGDPFWKRVAPDTEDADPVEAIAERLRESRATVLDWAERRRQGVVVLGLLFTAFLLTAIALRKRALVVAEEDPSLAVSAAILQRPVSVAIALALLNFVLVGPPLPRAVASLLGLIVILPLVVALRPAFSERSRPALYAVLAFFLLERLRELVGTAPIVADALHGAELLGACVVLGWLYRSGRIREMAPGPVWVRILGWAQPIALALLVTALLADLFGWLGLSMLISEATVRSIVRAFAIWGLVQVTHAIVAISFRSLPAQRLHVVRHRGDFLRNTINTLLQLGFGYFWILATLEDFGIRGPVTDAVGGLLTEQLEVGTLAISLADVLTFAAAVALAIYASRFVAFFIDEEVMPRVTLPRGVPYAISATARYTVLMLGFLAAVSAAGIDMTKFAVLAGALGVGIGFGMQNIVNNFVSGLILLFERPIQAGDTISLGELMGEVRRIGIRASTVRSFDGAAVIVPNANLVSDQVINWTLSDRERRMEIEVGVEYGTDPDRVIAILRELLEGRDDLSSAYETDVHFMGFDESSLRFRVRAWAANFDDFWNVRSQLCVDISRALAAAGIRIPFPQRDLHLRSADGLAAGASKDEPA